MESLRPTDAPQSIAYVLYGNDLTRRNLDSLVDNSKATAYTNVSPFPSRTVMGRTSELLKNLVLVGHCTSTMDSFCSAKRETVYVEPAKAMK